jgi:hypothetical protein
MEVVLPLRRRALTYRSSGSGTGSSMPLRWRWRALCPAPLFSACMESSIGRGGKTTGIDYSTDATPRPSAEASR